MKELKMVEKISKSFLPKDKYKKIHKIKNKRERLEIIKNSLISELRLKHIELDIKIKNIKDKKKRNFFDLKSGLISPKIRLLSLDFNEKDFKKINSLILILEKEVNDV
ncbi:MAG: hypothetical protein BWY36_00026 [Candidatus Diapherotrites archaeon ADurb.Bin253]|jgi:hypothetical protein|nr:MAG: hypothetical protein BWY36_00026 [Candidatus Diapherotrites archaeon ADurb.Bin253]HNZ52136.1 hypothetical protein [Candidatus Pacearchaeota archaeon]HOC96838.1 hypothetical protein [Candidatus Pacearchaeota archaeon]HPX74363.1 hypothetical protein [Candidatus Pacearchaeota archaeon]HQC60877.1 hypothetical protein [Candidatus Pacearchaeota archaeon]